MKGFKILTAAIVQSTGEQEAFVAASLFSLQSDLLTVWNDDNLGGDGRAELEKRIRFYDLAKTRIELMDELLKDCSLEQLRQFEIDTWKCPAKHLVHKTNKFFIRHGVTDVESSLRTSFAG